MIILGRSALWPSPHPPCDFTLSLPSPWQHLKTPPQSVVLVGHSMGGVVARALYTLPRFNPSLVGLIITQASPHLAPVLALDPFLLGRRSLALLLMGLEPLTSSQAVGGPPAPRVFRITTLFLFHCCRFLLGGAAEVGQSGQQAQERHGSVSRGRLP